MTKGLRLLAVSLAILCGACRSTSGQCTTHSQVEERGQCDGPCQQIAAGVNQFGIDLYHHLAALGSDNICFSPFSISTALSMAYIGAEGESAVEMAAVLHYPLAREPVAQAFGLFQKEIAGRIYAANGLWLQEGMPLEPQFTEMMERNYCGDMQTTDFARSPKRSIAKINHWVANQTNERIESILQPTDLTSATRMALVATLYLRAGWKTPFSPSQSRTVPFYLKGGTSVLVEAMQQEGSFGYYEGDHFVATKLSYLSEGEEAELAMWLLLPTDLTDLTALEESLSADLLNAIRKGMTQESVDLLIPKFLIEARLDLGELLVEMGMANPFSTRANFSGINGGSDLRLEQVVHGSVVEVNEEGTEAAAATVATIGLKSIPPQFIKTFYADHPFIFFIIDEELDLIYFIGRVVDPTR